MIKVNETNVTIMVKDMDKAVSFYENIGLTLKNRWGNHYAMLTSTGLTIGLHPSEETYPQSGQISIGFMIDKIDDAKALLDKNKIAYKYEADGKSGLYVHFKDPDGTVLYFTEPKWS